MKNIPRFLKCAAIDAALACAIYAWKFEGSEGCGNVVVFWFWFCAVAGVFTIVLPATGKQKPRVKWIVRFNAAMDLFFIVVLTYFGHFALAAGYATGALFARVYSDRFDDEGLPKKGTP